MAETPAYLQIGCQPRKVFTVAKKKARAISLLDGSVHTGGAGHYEFLSAVTGGISVCFKTNNPRSISEVTVEILLSCMGVQKDGLESVHLPATLVLYANTTGITALQSEEDGNASNSFGKGSTERFTYTALSTSILRQHMPKMMPPQNLTKTYKESVAYRSIVTQQLREIIGRDITTISLNPVFGSLWRTFCNERNNEKRQELLDLFGQKVQTVGNETEREKMKIWLEESYDYTAEVLNMISEVPELQRFPCVCPVCSGRR